MPYQARCPDGRMVTFPGSTVVGNSELLAACLGGDTPAAKSLAKNTATAVKYATDAQMPTGFSFSGGGQSPLAGGSPVGFPSGGSSQSTVGDIVKGVAGAADPCQYLPDYLQAACRAGLGAVGIGTGGKTTSTAGSTKGTTKMGTNGSGPCPAGTVRVGNDCVNASAALPGGTPFTTAAGQQAVQGAFGMPALTPTIESRTVRKCPRRYVLGEDNLCYPKAVLPRRSKYRKWRQARKPLFTAGDLKAIRKAERLKKKGKEIAKDLGWKVRK